MLEFEVAAGKVFGDGEKVDNDKLNALGVPTITVSGGLENAQARVGAWQFYEAASDDWSSAPNRYDITLDEEEQDPGATLEEGTLLAFKVPVGSTNTGAATLRLINSSGTIVSTAAIERRGRDLALGELAAGEIFEVRWDGTAWQLVGGAMLQESEESVPGPFWWGTDTASTATAYVMTMDPWPTALEVGMKVRFEVPVRNGSGVTLLLKNVTGVDIGVAAAIQRIGTRGSLVGVGVNELVAGQMVEVVYTGSVWQLQTTVALDGVSANGVDASGLTVGNNAATPATKVDIAAAELAVGIGISGGGVRALGSVSVTVDIAVSGANGLDTGSAANSTWYYLYVIWNGVSAAGLISASASSPTLPEGYSHYTRVGAVYRDSGGSFFNFYQAGRVVHLRPAEIFTAKAATAGNTYQALSGGEETLFKAVVPPIAKYALGYGGSSLAGNGVAMGIAADSNGLGEQLLNAYTAAGAWDTMYAAVPFRCVLKTAQTIYWKAPDTVARAVLRVTGFEI